jgi:hypothetical protein
MDDHDRIRVAQMTSLRKRIDDGLASLDRCEGADGEQFMESLILSVDRKTRPAKG